MAWRALADMVLVVHLGFIVLAVLGGLLVLRHPRFAWVHLPCMVWAALVELAGLYCPLTPLEDALRRRGGEAGVGASFVAHYLLPLVYPGGLTREVQYGLGSLVVIVNTLVYAWVVRRLRGRGGRDG